MSNRYDNNDNQHDSSNNNNNNAGIVADAVTLSNNTQPWWRARCLPLAQIAVLLSLRANAHPPLVTAQGHGNSDGTRLKPKTR